MILGFYWFLLVVEIISKHRTRPWLTESTQTTLLTHQRCLMAFPEILKEWLAPQCRPWFSNELQTENLHSIATTLFMDRHSTFFGNSLSRTVIITGCKASHADITVCFFICHSKKVSQGQCPNYVLPLSCWRLLEGSGHQETQGVHGSGGKWAT